MTYLTSPKVAGKSAVIAPPKSSTGLNPDIFFDVILSIDVAVALAGGCAAALTENCFCSPVRERQMCWYQMNILMLSSHQKRQKMFVLILYSFADEVESQRAAWVNVKSRRGAGNARQLNFTKAAALGCCLHQIIVHFPRDHYKHLILPL